VQYRREYPQRKPLQKPRFWQRYYAESLVRGDMRSLLHDWPDPSPFEVERECDGLGRQLPRPQLFGHTSPWQRQAARRNKSLRGNVN